MLKQIAELHMRRASMALSESHPLACATYLEKAARVYNEMGFKLVESFVLDSRAHVCRMMAAVAQVERFDRW